MRKSVLKRIKITKNGKLLRRRVGLNHFNAKMPRKNQLRKKTLSAFTGHAEKKIRQYLMQ